LRIGLGVVLTTKLLFATTQADEENIDNLSEDQLAELKKKRTFRKFAYRGVDLDQLLDLTSEQVPNSDVKVWVRGLEGIAGGA